MLVGVVDALKGVIPVAFTLVVLGRPQADLVWLAAVCGHVWPVARGFRGGKGVATAGGGGLILTPLIGVLAGLVFAAVVRTTRVAALGSLAIATLYPPLILATGSRGWELLIGVLVSGLVVFRHRSNIVQMRAGRKVGA